MKTVLCYGDSNTYGFNPANGLRYPQDMRWTGKLQSLLGNDYRIIEEGCMEGQRYLTILWKDGKMVFTI